MPNPTIAWVPVGAGRLALDHRPRLRRIPHLADEGCDRVVTLLCAREGAEEIGARVRGAGMAWTWIPLAGARPPEGRHERAVRREIEGLVERLAAGESILIHCSAGIHRTGMVAHALLRACGFAREAALQSIGAMRDHTREGLREEHLLWGDRTDAGPASPGSLTDRLGDPASAVAATPRPLQNPAEPADAPRRGHRPPG